MVFRTYFLCSIFFFVNSVCTAKNANTANRYPFVLPMCCEPNRNFYQVNNFSNIDRKPIGPCANEGPKVVLLPKQLFPAMSPDTEYVEVELRNLVDGLKCDEGHDDSDIQIEFADLDRLTTVTLGRTKVLYEYSFSGDNLLAANGSTYSFYSPHHFCITSRTTNKTQLHIKTCKQKYRPRSSFIPRCCGGHQSILLSPPTSSKESFLGYCSTPTLRNDPWTPTTSKILAGVNSHTNFYPTRYVPITLEDASNKSKKKTCRLLRFIQNPLDDETPLTLLNDGRLQLTIENTTEIIEEYCIDGMHGVTGNRSTGDTGEDCEIAEEQEVVVAYVCSSPAMGVYYDRHITNLPACSCVNSNSDQPFHLILDPHPPGAYAATKVAVPGRLTTGANGRSLDCPGGFKDSTVEFKDATGLPFWKDGSLFLNGSHLDPTQFCIRSFFNNAVRVRTCKEKCGPKNPCVNRCCSGNTHIDLDASKLYRRMICVAPNSTTAWSLRFYASPEDSHPISESDLDIQPLIRKRQPYGRFCYFVEPERVIFTNSFRVGYKLMTTADLMEKWGKKKWMKVNQEDYCIEPSTKRGKNRQLQLTGHHEDALVWRCWRDPKDYKDYVEYKANVSLLIALLTQAIMSLIDLIPSLFYMLIAVVYILRKDKEPVFRWSIVFFSISTTLYYWQTIYKLIALISLNLQSYYIAALAIGHFATFCELYGICWMSVLCFDMWFTITFLTPGSKSMKRMWGYVAFTFAVPVAYVGAGVFLDIFYFQQLYYSATIPARNVYGYFRYGLFGLLAFTNFILFITTAVKLRISQKSSDIKAQRKTFMMYLKLFFVMGVRFLIECLNVAYSELNESVLMIEILGLALLFMYLLAHPILFFYFLVWNVDTKRYMENNHPRIKKIMDFIDCIGYPARKCFGFCRCCKRPEDGEKCNGADDAPHNSTHMYVHTKPSNSNPKKPTKPVSLKK